MKTHYQVKDFPSKYDFEIGMLIEAIIDDDIYHITAGEAYEIIEVHEVHNDLSIRFINDTGNGESKLINISGYPFDRYFRIL